MDAPLHAGRVANQVMLFAGFRLLVQQPEADGPVVDSRRGRARSVQRGLAKVVNDERLSQPHDQSLVGRARLASPLAVAAGGADPVRPPSSRCHQAERPVEGAVPPAFPRLAHNVGVNTVAWTLSYVLPAALSGWAAHAVATRRLAIRPLWTVVGIAL